MPCKAGDLLGPYEILAPIGAGGMGEVYRARDTRLGREVAIKISQERFTDRFEREARAVAALNHPNICQLYDVGPSFLVMEFVEGENLSGPLPLATALDYARQIAEALEAAHEKGIIHRDLKPANIKVTPAGVVKVLDFGLAKATEEPSTASSPTNSPTLTMSPTRAGMILGTAPYMAPEQARGKLVDKRADIWAFGCVLYEMLTGERLFQGEDVTDILAAVLRHEPEFDLVPLRLRRLMRKCLEKDPKNRLRDIGDAWALLDEDRPSRRPILRSALGWVMGVVGLAVVGAMATLHFRAAPTGETVRFEIPLPAGVNFGLIGAFAISPDGRKLAFSAAGADWVPRIWIRNLDSLEAQSLPGAETGPALASLFWSPDSRFVAYQAEGKLKKIDVSGGPPQTVCDAPFTVIGGSWNPDGVILFGAVFSTSSASSPVMRVPAAGGVPVPVTAVDPARHETGHGFPWFLPDGQHFLYVRGSSAAENQGLYLGSLGTKPEAQSLRRVMPADTQVLYAAGYILFAREGTLLAQAFDAVGLRLSGEPVALTEQVGRPRIDPLTVLSTTQAANQLVFFSASESGSLVYRTRSNAQGATQLTWLDRDGEVRGKVADPARYAIVKLSPDGKRAATARTDPQSGNLDIWTVDLVSGASTRFTFDPATDSQPVWSPDGRRIAWNSNRGGAAGIYQKASNGLGTDELLYRGPGNLTNWSSDGHFLLFNTTSPQSKVDIWALPVGEGTSGEHKPFPVIQTPATELGGYVSPDGRWIAYISDESGRNEIYVQPFNPAHGARALPLAGKWMVSKGALGMPRWRADGKELTYISSDGRMMSVDVTLNPVFQSSTPRQLFQLPRAFLGLSQTPGTLADSTRDLKRFLIAMPVQEAGRQELTVVLNWSANMKR